MKLLLKILLLVFLIVMGYGCSYNPTTTQAQIEDVDNIKTRYDTAQKTWLTFRGDFKLVSIKDSELRKGTGNVLLAVDNGFKVTNATFSTKGRDYEARLYAGSSLWTAYQSSKKAVIGLRDVYRLKKDTLTPQQRAMYESVYASFKDLSDSIPDKQLVDKNIDKWIILAEKIAKFVKTIR